MRAITLRKTKRITVMISKLVQRQAMRIYVFAAKSSRQTAQTQKCLWVVERNLENPDTDLRSMDSFGADSETKAKLERWFEDNDNVKVKWVK